VTARTLAVVGGGISGLAAAHRAARHGLRVTVLEAGDTAGGCLSRTGLGGLLPGGADEGAEASLARRPEARALVEDLGLTPVHPSRIHGSRLVTDRGPVATPAATLWGGPADPKVLRGVLSDAGVERARTEVLTPPTAQDVSCGDFLAARLGDELVDRVVDPLVGGVYAGRCRELSLSATIPALLPAAQQGTSVLAAVAEILAARTRTRGADIPGAGAHGPRTGAAADRDTPAEAGAGSSAPPPVFLSLAGGINGLIPALADSITDHGGEIRTGTPVRAIAPGGRIRTDAGDLTADHILLAVPAPAARALLTQDVAAGQEADEQAYLATLLDRIPYASSAVITAVLEDRVRPLEGSGLLVPADLGGLLKAATHSSNKWPWLEEALPAGRRVIRMSVGRHGDEAWRDLADREIIDRALGEWRALTGWDGALVHAEVKRWIRALPQYAPGHSDLVRRIETAAAGVPGLSLTGSYLDGVGIPACIGRAQAAVDRIVAHAAPPD
jgi:oxygen-dependent protoporphyrinogen oxidase